MYSDTKRKIELDKAQEELEKLKLEKEKVQLETSELRRKFYEKPQWWAFFTSFIISAFTFFTLWANGTFYSIRAKTEADFAVLKLEKKIFEIEKNRLDILIKQKTDSLYNLNDSLLKIIIKNRNSNKENFELTNLNIRLLNSIKSKDQVVYKLLDSINRLNLKPNTQKKADTSSTLSSMPNDRESNFDVSIYPKTATDYINIIIQGGSGGKTEVIKINFYNSNGTLVYSSSETRANTTVVKYFDIGHFPKGNYQLKVSLNEKIHKDFSFVKQ